MDKIRICIVDDQDIVIDAIKLILEPEDSLEIVGSFYSAESFIEQYELLEPDVTIMDLDLPVLSGIDAIITIKQAYPQARFLVLTNYDDDERLFNSLKAGAGGYLLKKKSLEDIAESIKTICNGGAPMTPHIARKVIHFFQRHNVNGMGNFQKLNERETTVLKLLAEGLLYKEIADTLNVSIDTIKKNTQHIYEKLQVRTRSEAIKKYLSP